jgi:hypothetical protein
VLPICDVLSLARGLDEVLLDYCELTYEQLRIFLAALLALKPRSESEALHGRGVAKLSLVGNNSIGLDGWRSLACFVHMVSPLNLDLTVECGSGVVEYKSYSSIDGSGCNPCQGNSFTQPMSTRNSSGIQTTANLTTT